MIRQSEKRVLNEHEIVQLVAYTEGLGDTASRAWNNFWGNGDPLDPTRTSMKVSHTMDKPTAPVLLPNVPQPKSTSGPRRKRREATVSGRGARRRQQKYVDRRNEELTGEYNTAMDQYNKSQTFTPKQDLISRINNSLPMRAVHTLHDLINRGVDDASLRAYLASREPFQKIDQGLQQVGSGVKDLGLKTWSGTKKLGRNVGRKMAQPFVSAGKQIKDVYRNVMDNPGVDTDKFAKLGHYTSSESTINQTINNELNEVSFLLGGLAAGLGAWGWNKFKRNQAAAQSNNDYQNMLQNYVRYVNQNAKDAKGRQLDIVNNMQDRLYFLNPKNSHLFPINDELELNLRRALIQYGVTDPAKQQQFLSSPKFHIVKSDDEISYGTASNDPHKLRRKDADAQIGNSSDPNNDSLAVLTSDKRGPDGKVLPHGFKASDGKVYNIEDALTSNPELMRYWKSTGQFKDPSSGAMLTGREIAMKIFMGQINGQIAKAKKDAEVRLKKMDDRKLHKPYERLTQQAKAFEFLKDPEVIKQLTKFDKRRTGLFRRWLGAALGYSQDPRAQWKNLPKEVRDNLMSLGINQRTLKNSSIMDRLNNADFRSMHKGYQIGPDQSPLSISLNMINRGHTLGDIDDRTYQFIQTFVLPGLKSQDPTTKTRSIATLQHVLQNTPFFKKMMGDFSTQPRQKVSSKWGKWRPVAYGQTSFDKEGHPKRASEGLVPQKLIMPLLAEAIVYEYLNEKYTPGAKPADWKSSYQQFIGNVPENGATQTGTSEADPLKALMGSSSPFQQARPDLASRGGDFVGGVQNAFRNFGDAFGKSRWQTDHNVRDAINEFISDPTYDNFEKLKQNPVFSRRNPLGIFTPAQIYTLNKHLSDPRRKQYGWMDNEDGIDISNVDQLYQYDQARVQRDLMLQAQAEEQRRATREARANRGQQPQGQQPQGQPQNQPQAILQGQQPPAGTPTPQQGTITPAQPAQAQSGAPDTIQDVPNLTKFDLKNSIGKYQNLKTDSTGHIILGTQQLTDYNGKNYTVMNDALYKLTPGANGQQVWKKISDLTKTPTTANQTQTSTDKKSLPWKNFYAKYARDKDFNKKYMIDHQHNLYFRDKNGNPIITIDPKSPEGKPFKLDDNSQLGFINGQLYIKYDGLNGNSQWVPIETLTKPVGIDYSMVSPHVEVYTFNQFKKHFKESINFMASEVSPRNMYQLYLIGKLNKLL